LLDRALEQVPKAVLESSRFQIPEAEVVIVGNRTILRNFRNLASALNREPEHLVKYLLRELGAAGNLEGNQAIFQGKFSRDAVNDRVKRYVEGFVSYMLQCEACGARASVRSV